MIHLRDDVKSLFSEERTVADFFNIESEIAKQRHNRCTMRIERGGRAFYLKLHHPVGLYELFKSFAHLRMPDVGAMDEWHAIQRFHELQIPTMRAAGYGIEGRSLIAQRSFLLTDALPDLVSLEQIAQGRCDIELTADLKRELIIEMARLTGRMHQAGVNHRDLYLAHFALVGHDRKMHVIDLHRAQCRDATPHRWAVKDLAAILFSSLGVEPTVRDKLRFIKHYGLKPYRENRSFWADVESRAAVMQRKGIR